MIVHQSVERTSVSPRRVLVGVLLLAGVMLIASPTASAGSLETARVQSIVGAASVDGGAVAESTQFRKGDVLSVLENGRVTVGFDDGGSLALTGPARLAFVDLDSDGRRVRLDDGAITRALAGGVALEVQTRAGASLVLQNASGAANVLGNAVSFSKLGGHYARLWRGGRAQDLRGSWSNGLGVVSGAGAPKITIPTTSVPAMAPVMAPVMAAESARVCALSGSATSTRGGRSTRASSNSTFAAGDSLSVAAGGKMTVCFADNSSVALVGPATMSLVQLDSTGRRVRLDSGVIAEAYTRGVALEIQTPAEPSLVLQNATGFARVAPGDRISFQKLDGDYAQVFANGKGSPLAGAWTYNTRSGSATSGGAPAASTGGKTSRSASSAGASGPGALSNVIGTPVSSMGDAGVLQLGDRTISYRPASEFSQSAYGDGGAKLTYTGNDFGVVFVGSDTGLFLANGDWVAFDGTGHIEEFTGIVHMYQPLTGFDFYDRPVENAGDASVVQPGRR